MRLDEVDKQILNELFEDGRVSLTDLNNRIFKSDQQTMSHTGVKKRISKLSDSEIMKIQGNINIETLNYRACLIFLEMKNYEKVKELSIAYSNCPRVFFLAQTTGQYDIIIGIIGQSVDVLHQYLNYCGPTNKEGVLHSDILFISKFNIPKYLPINLFSNSSQETKCGNICVNCEAYLDGKCEGCGNF